MPNAALARRTRDQIINQPSTHDQKDWMTGPDLRLAPDSEPDSDTTLCTAGWAAHFSGHTLVNDAESGFTARKDGQIRDVADAAREALEISEQDAAGLFDEDILPEQTVAALDQLADGAPSIEWEVAYAAAYSLADGDFSGAGAWEARRAWGITHDLLVNGSRRSGTYGISATAMRFIVAGWHDAREPAEPSTFWRDDLGVWTTAAGHRYVPRLAEAAVVYPGNMRASDDIRRVVGTLNLTPVAPYGDRRLHHIIVPAIHLPELAASPHVGTTGTPAVETVYTYLGVSWPPLTGDACQRCGSTGFLARATQWTGSPAFCIACHETLRTQEAQAGHQCADGCSQPVDHTGLCRP